MAGLGRSSERLLAALLVCLPAFSQSLITTLAGTDWIFTGDGQPALNVPLGAPRGVVVERSGAVLFSDFENHVVLRLGPDGILKTVAGNGLRGFSGDGGPATRASLNFPQGLALDAAGNLYVVDGRNLRVRRVTPAGIITTLAGNGPVGFSGDGGPATNAALSSPEEE